MMNKVDTQNVVVSHHESTESTRSPPLTSQPISSSIPPTNIIERIFKPTKYTARYPQWMVGRRILWTTCFLCSLGDALFGYDQGIMAGLLVNPTFIQRFYGAYGASGGNPENVNPSLIGITVSCLQLSAAIGALLAGYLGDIIGRKKCVTLGGLIYLITGFVQAFAPNLACFIAGRTIQGLGVGILSMTVPIIQTEIAAPHSRGLMVGIEYTFLIGGYMTSCWVDYGFSFQVPHNISWRGPFFVQVFMASIMTINSLFIVESPRWLAKNRFPKEALQTLADLHSNGDIKDSKVLKVFTELQKAVNLEADKGNATWYEMFTTYRKQTFVGVTAQMFAQLNGINVISFYLPSSLSSAGFSAQQALLFTAANAVIYTTSTVPTWWLADRWGRRPLLMSGGGCMAVALGIMCVFKEVPGLSVVMRANGMFAFVVLYNALYGATWGPIPWLLPAEIFPLRARSKGMALSTFSNWTFNFIIGMSSPAAFARLHGYYYNLISGLCLISVVLVKFYFPETRDCTLEGVANKFQDKTVLEEDEKVAASTQLSKKADVGPEA